MNSMMEEGNLVVLPTAMGGILKEMRRVSDPDKAQIIWDGIKTVRAQKQIPALPRLSRYKKCYKPPFPLLFTVFRIRLQLGQWIRNSDLDPAGLK
jgi:hypothetical protein